MAGTNVTIRTGHFWIRLLFTSLILGTTGAGTYLFARLVWTRGLTFPGAIMLVIFALLYFWLSIAFWMATLGMILCLLSRKPSRQPFEPTGIPLQEYAHLPKTVMLMPICNEDPSRVFSGVLAMHESLLATGHASNIDFFVLSDTTDPEIWMLEEAAWAIARRTAGLRKRDGEEEADGGIYYRRRQNNLGKKSGNIRDFCQQWGGRYKYMVVLDADSLMDGWSVIEMIRRMEKQSKLGILQVPPVLVSHETVFARMQQFVSRVYGEIYVRAYAFWSQGESNYWGHNAIVRTDPFIRHCGLPQLPGREPLGGEILSHDFVEAALMLRGGWEVRLAGDLGGSYEEPPVTIMDFVRRSRRWCQGDLQHLRLILLRGFHAVSRIYFGMGAMTYLSSLLWLIFVVLSLINGVGARGHSVLILTLMTVALLFLPKVWGYLALLSDRARMRTHGGLVKVALSVFLEAAVSILTSPIFMLFNVRFVLSILAGRGVKWDPQRRDDAAVAVRQAIHQYSLHTGTGVVAVSALLWFGSYQNLWLLILLAGLVLSIPIEIALSSLWLGRRLRQLGLFLGPEEAEPPAVLRRQHALRIEIQRMLQFRRRGDIFRRMVLDGALNAIHIGVLQAQGLESEDWDKVEPLAQVALYGGPEHLTLKDRRKLLSNQAAMQWLHRQAWKQWKL
jgi:membrane glycosyltransferase